MEDAEIFCDRHIREGSEIGDLHHLLPALFTCVRRPEPAGNHQAALFLSHDVIVMQLPVMVFCCRKLIAAVSADLHLGCQDLVTSGADLRGRKGIAILLLSPRNSHIRDRSMGFHDTGEIEYQTVIGMALQSQAPASHLDIQSRGESRPHHDNKIDIGIIEAGGQHIGIRESPDLSILERIDDSLPILLAGGPGDAVSSDSMS